jgi:hypothetical protein
MAALSLTPHACYAGDRPADTELRQVDEKMCMMAPGSRAQMAAELLRIVANRLKLIGSRLTGVNVP